MKLRDALLHRLRSAGITPDDSDDLRQQKSLLYFVSGLVSIAAAMWLLVYWLAGPRLSSSLPFGLQVAIAGNLLVYAAWGRFKLFRTTLLCILLFFPFVAQCALGDFVSASGLVLWGLLAPLCALLCLGVEESGPWFAAYVVLTLLTGAMDFFLADSQLSASTIPRRISLLFFALNFATISVLVYLSMRFAIHERNQTLVKLEDAHARLALEQARSERLLLNILPARIAERLKDPEATVVDGAQDVSVMFADIVNFTELAAHLPPEAVFALLNHVFGKFDDLAEAHGLEKIKTIGDAYMVAGGLDDHLPDPCQAVAELALEMCEWLARDDHLKTAVPLQLRIGISTGPVVAGVVGKKKFIYDLWGDTVNLAHRITTESMPNTILCDSATFLRLKYRFVFEDPVTLRLKGKGMVSVWRLLSRSSTSLRQPVLDVDLTQ
ncbi:MAG: adenylate/guanylate cyclase domain-containing protein [Uliginosibacterium sp.]|nr:adenylate/guanylate cyclase domain-containing protein [Uliginosibacterium sp.]